VVLNYAENQLRHNQQTAIPAIALLTSPPSRRFKLSLSGWQIIPIPNPDLKIALQLVLQGRIIPQDAGERVAIAYTPSITGEISSNTIRGVMIASSRGVAELWDESQKPPSP